MIKIDDVWYKEIPKNLYVEYLKECKELNVKPEFKSYKKEDCKTIIVYKIVNKQELEKLNKPVLDLNNILLLDTSGKVLEKSEKVVAPKKLGTIPSLHFSKSNNYQYCDNCNIETNHYLVMGVLGCAKCFKGYYV